MAFTHALTSVVLCHGLIGLIDCGVTFMPRFFVQSRLSPWLALRAIGPGQARQARRDSMRTEESGGRRGGRSQGLSRRRLLLGATATAGLLTLGQGDWVQTTAQTDGLPTPEASGIAHIVWVMMENRS